MGGAEEGRVATGGPVRGHPLGSMWEGSSCGWKPGMKEAPKKGFPCHEECEQGSLVPLLHGVTPQALIQHSGKDGAASGLVVKTPWPQVRVPGFSADSSLAAGSSNWVLAAYLGHQDGILRAPGGELVDGSSLECARSLCFSSNKFKNHSFKYLLCMCRP